MIDDLLPIRSRSIAERVTPLAKHSLAASVEAMHLDTRLVRARKLLSEPLVNLAHADDSNSTTAAATNTERLRLKSNAFRQMAAKVAMHLDGQWRKKLFENLDRLLDPDDWPEGAAMPSEQSFSTFLRLIIYLHPSRRPGLGLSPAGNFLAAWRSGEDRIVIECLANDEVRWVLSRVIDGERESGAGKVQIHRVPDVVEPYDPEPLFNNGDKVLA